MPPPPPPDRSPILRPRPLPRKDRLLLQLVALPAYLMALMLGFGAVWFLRTGVATGRGDAITRADQPFGFYLSVVVMIVLAVYAAWLGVTISRAK
jgi:hypothetical protein